MNQNSKLDLQAESERKYRVTVKAPTYPDYTVEVSAPDEWMARTRAMMFYPHSLRGETVDYTVTETTQVH